MLQIHFFSSPVWASEEKKYALGLVVGSVLCHDQASQAEYDLEWVSKYLSSSSLEDKIIHPAEYF